MGQYSLRSLYFKFGVHYFLSRAWILGNFWLIYLTRKGFSLQDAALMDVLFWTVMLVSEVPTGYIADWFGRKTSMVISFFIQAFAIFLFAIANNLAIFLLSYALWGFGMTFQSGAEEAWIYDEVLNITGDDESYQRFFGKLLTIGFLAMAASGYISGPLAEIKIEYTIYGTMVVFLLDALWLLTIPETSPSMEQEEEKPSVRVAFQSLFGERITPLVAIRWFNISIMLSVIFWFQVFLDSNRISFTNIAIILSTGAVLTSIGSWKSDNITGGKGNWVMLPILSSILLLLFIMQFSLGSAIIAYLLLHIFRGIWGPFFSRLINRELTSKVRATALSIIGAGMTISVVTYEYISAWYIETRSYNAFFQLSSILLLLLVIPIAIYYIMITRRDEVRQQVEAVLTGI